MAQANLQPSGWRVLAGLVLAPVLPALLFATLVPAYAGLPERWVRIVATAPWALVIGGYVPILFVGLPTYAIARRRLRLMLPNAALLGAFVAALPWALLGFLPIAGEASIDGQATIVDGRLTWFGAWEVLKFIVPIGLLGAVGGGVFWLIVAKPAFGRAASAKT